VSSRVKGKGHTLASATIATKRQHATARDVDDDGLGRAALQQSRASWCGPSAKPLGRCLSPGRYRWLCLVAETTTAEGSLPTGLGMARWKQVTLSPGTSRSRPRLAGWVIVMMNRLNEA